MNIQIRQAGPDDYREIARMDGISFAASYSEEDLGDTFDVDPPRLLVATEGDRIVGATGEYRFTMTVPGGGALDLPGVTWVSVLPTYRRRGILRSLMQRQLSEFAAAGEPAAVLTASEGGIYRRFGYGPATQRVKTVLDRRFANLISPVDSSAVEFVSPEAARTRLPELHRRWRETTPGALSRVDSWWDQLFRDREAHRGGMTEKLYLVHPDGYLAYRAAEVWDDGHPRHRCLITDYRCVTDEAHAALWQVLLGMDLFASMESWEVPVDDPLRFLLTDSRQLRSIAVDDGMWLRPVEVATLLAARSYQVEVEAVLQVGDQRVLLAGGPDGASCEPTTLPAQLELALPGLGSAYLGGYRLRTLERAGLVRGENPGLIRQLDLAFGADRAPGYGTGF
ncbi:MAG: GNAT family N-acetyltransferase [Actinomycetota bacterium]|nr:GNAT family N-acetyltransferase [Actinomycetota bacterium]MDQ2957655.1 GNAT family N-acetyltransferase [Actinomycetota bacterium]